VIKQHLTLRPKLFHWAWPVLPRSKPQSRVRALVAGTRPTDLPSFKLRQAVSPDLRTSPFANSCPCAPCGSCRASEKPAGEPAGCPLGFDTLEVVFLRIYFHARPFYDTIVTKKQELVTNDMLAGSKKFSVSNRPPRSPRRFINDQEPLSATSSSFCNRI
jgi:hypothetical protein